MQIRNRIWMSTLAGVLVFATATAAQDNKRRPNPYRGSPLMWNVDEIVDDYLSKLGRYYNLTETQQKATSAMMTQRVKGFLGKYERDIRSMFADLMEYQLRGEIPPAPIAKEWAQRGSPLVAAIKGEIMEGTMEWRRILTDEQKLKHDKDLRALEREFKQYEERFDRWSKGDVRSSDFLGARISTRPPRIRKGEDAWQSYVRSFCAAYKLDKSQRDSAYSLLRELREEAKKYRESRKEEFEKLEADFEKVTSRDPNLSAEEVKERAEKIRELNDKQVKLEEPIAVEMFGRLKIGLEKVPTEDQRKAREQHMTDLRELAQRKRYTPPTTQPETGSATTKPEQASAQ